MKQTLASKIFLSDSNNENLNQLLNLDFEELFSKYEASMSDKNSVELTETNETLADTKVKLSLQAHQRKIYEDQLNEMVNILEIPKKDGCFDEVLQTVKDLMESERNLREKAEIGLYSRAEDVIERHSKTLKE